MGGADRLPVALVSRAIDAAPHHRPVLALLAGLDLDATHRRVLDAVVPVGDRARPVRWCGPGPLDLAGGPGGAVVVAGVIGWEVVRPFVLAPVVVDAVGAVVPVEVLAARLRGDQVETRLRAALVAAAHSLTVGSSDPARIAERLRHRLAEVAA